MLLTTMKKSLLLLLYCTLNIVGLKAQDAGTFPDGVPIGYWFTTVPSPQLEDFPRQFVITEYGVVQDSTLVQTEALQLVITQASQAGGGIVVIPKGVFLSGALFFQQGVSLWLQEGAVLKGSDNIADYPVIPSRMEGQNLDYYPALINVYSVNGFRLLGKGTVNGNGLKFWNAFWQRRKENPQCTNLEVARPRLLFFWNCSNVLLKDIHLMNAGFWTTHFYKCYNVKIIGLSIFSPATPVKAPSTDGIDIDACTDFVIKDTYISVNDDAIALKGGKGPQADSNPDNAANERIIIENCTFGFCHAALTCGSESIHNRNILFRNCTVKGANRLLWLKMRDDTPQLYEYITVENIQGEAGSLLFAKPWTQFKDLNGETEKVSVCSNIIIKDVTLQCDVFFNVEVNQWNQLHHFTFENLSIKAKHPAMDKSLIPGMVLDDVVVNGISLD